MNPVAIFCSNEGAVTGFLAVSDGEDLAEGGKYEGLVVAGFDAGAAQKNAVRQGWFDGSVTQDPYQIGYQAVPLWPSRLPTAKLLKTSTPALSGMTLPTSTT